MALSVLNNIASLAAQNQLTITNGNLQKALFQLSSGSRINTGADDPARVLTPRGGVMGEAAGADSAREPGAALCCGADAALPRRGEASAHSRALTPAIPQLAHQRPPAPLLGKAKSTLW